MSFLPFASNHWELLKIFMKASARKHLPKMQAVGSKRRKNKKIHDERNLCEPYLEEEARLIFQHGKIYFLNKYSQSINCIVI